MARPSIESLTSYQKDLLEKREQVMRQCQLLLVRRRQGQDSSEIVSRLGQNRVVNSVSDTRVATAESECGDGDYIDCADYIYPICCIKLSLRN